MSKVPTPPGYTSDVDKYYIELAHWILDNAGRVNIEEPALKSLEDARQDYEYAKEDFESDPSKDNEMKMIKANIAMIKAEIAENKGRSTDFKADKGKEYKSSFGVKGNIGGRLKTRRHKHRNGSSRVRRHRSVYMSRRKD
jgi:hypothetical protein